MKAYQLVGGLSLLALTMVFAGCGKGETGQARDKQEQAAIQGAQAMPKREAVAANKLQNRAGVIYVVNGQEPFGGSAQDFYSSGQMKWEIEIEAGKVVVLKRWHENGVLELSCGFTAGTLGVVEADAYDLLKKHPERLDGEFAAYSDSGQKFATANFKNGKPVDEGRKRTPDGTEIKTMIVETIGAQMIRVAPGTFAMGSPASEEGRSPDETQHSVTLSEEFWLGSTEVTQGEWEGLMGRNPARFDDSKWRPVESVSWDEAMAFCQKVTQAEQQAGRLPNGYEYTLPTEAQWEYACRAGSTGAYAGDLVEMAWYGENSENETHGVGQKQMNAWGFYDMHGNVWEWCKDWYGDYPNGSVVDPNGANEGSGRVDRGGCWFDGASDCRSALRDWGEPVDRDDFLGFRLCLAPSSAIGRTKSPVEVAKTIPLMSANNKRAAATEAEAGLGTMRSALRAMYAETASYVTTPSGGTLAAGGAATTIPGISAGDLNGNYFQEGDYSIIAISASNYMLRVVGATGLVSGMAISLTSAGDFTCSGL